MIFPLIILSQEGQYFEVLAYVRPDQDEYLLVLMAASEVILTRKGMHSEGGEQYYTISGGKNDAW